MQTKSIGLVSADSSARLKHKLTGKTHVCKQQHYASRVHNGKMRAGKLFHLHFFSAETCTNINFCFNTRNPFILWIFCVSLLTTHGHLKPMTTFL